MLNRLQLVLLTAIPTGAALIYLLWTYRTKKKPTSESTSGVDYNTKSAPTIKVSVVDKSIIVDNDEVRSVENDARNVGSSGNETAVVDMMTVTSSSRLSCSTDASKLRRRSTPVDDRPDDVVPLSPAVTDISTDVDKVLADKTSIDYSLRKENCNSVDGMTSLDTEPGTEMIISKLAPPMTNGINGCCDSLTSGSDDDISTCNRKPCTEINDDDKTCSAVICKVRKDSTGSLSDKCSLDGSRDRNGNRRSQSKEKLMKSHSFDFPTELCGRLIGSRGRNITEIKTKTGAEIYIKPKQYHIGWQVVTLEGTRQQVNKALDMIRHRFPTKKFLGIDYNRCLPDVPVVSAAAMQLSLPTGIAVEVVVSHVVAPNHIFVQQPTHPTFPLLDRQMRAMRTCYTTDNVPELPRPISIGVICAAPYGSDWCRAQVVQAFGDVDEYDIKLVDQGGYVHVGGDVLRQIRTDFMSMPFQAIECYLASIIPPTEEEDFPSDTAAVLSNLVRGCILQCDVVAVAEDGVPYVVLTKVVGSQASVINRDLVQKGVARWYEM